MDIDSRTRNVDVSQLCRLCAVQDEHVVPIFEGHGLDLEFEIKLQKYLSLKVSKNDVLPLNICLKCSNTLMSWHELVIGCKEAEKHLLSLLCEQERSSDLDSNVIILNEDSQDSVEIIESDTADEQLVCQPNNALANLGISGTVNATIQGHQDSGGTVALVLKTAKSKDSENVQNPIQLLINQNFPTSTCKKAQSLTSKKNKSPFTIQPNTRPLLSDQSSSTPVGDSVLLKSQDGDNINVQSSLQPNTGQTTTIQSPKTSAIRKPVDKPITMSGKKFKAIVKPFLLSRPENTTVDTPQPVIVDKLPVTVDKSPITVDKPQPVTVNKPPITVDKPPITVDKPPITVDKPPITVDKPPITVDKPPITVDKPQTQGNTNIITLLIPGVIPPNSTPVISTDSSTNTPVITLPVVLPKPSSPSANQVLVPNIPENAFFHGFDPNLEVELGDSSNFYLQEVDNDSRGPSPSYSNNLTENILEPNVQEAATYSGPATRSKVALKAAETETGETEASEEAQPVFIIAHEDHRYSKSAKLASECASKPRSKDTGSARKNLLKALKRNSKKSCFVCSKVIHNRTLLASHERSHFRALECLSFNCNLCSESFKTFEEMVLHRKKHKNKKRNAERQKKRPSKPKQTDGTSTNNPGTSETGEGGSPSKSSKAKPNSTKKKPDEISPHIKCVICGLCFKNKLALSVHKHSHTEEERANPYVCPVCSKRFSNNGALRTHLKIHSDGPGELCPHCGKLFKLRTTLMQHVRKMHDVPNPWPRYQCEYCPRKFDSRAKLSTHSNCHTGDRPFRCNKCDKGFHSSSNLRQHLACHEDARPSMCHVCGKTFKWQKNLKQHAMTHVSKDLRPKSNKEDPVQCDLCGKKLNGVGSLKTHKYRFHRDIFFLENPNVQRLPCHLCSRVFSSTVNLDLHLQRFHADGQLRFGCDVCGKRFTTKVGRNDHLRLHTGERPYACQLCDKTFASASNLIAHKDAHSENRPHQCQYCDKQFKRKAHLDCHIRSHTGEKPYVCDICNRGFAQSNDMRKHRGTHFNERPFSCSFCENTFKKKKDLLRHLTKHCVSERPEDESDEIDYSAILPSDNDAIVAYEVC